MNEEEFFEMCKKHLRIIAHKVTCPDDTSDMLQICLTFRNENEGKYQARTIDYTEVELPYDVRWD